MRISSSMMYSQGVASVQNQYSDLARIQNQMSTGRRILTPSDDPIAAARVLEVSQSKSTNEQYMRNADLATGALQLQEAILGNVSDILYTARVLTINAGNPGLSVSDRASLAEELQANYDHLLSLANSTDGNGQFMFSGFQGSTQAFSETSPGNIVYNGDYGQRKIQITSSRQVPVSFSGDEVFRLIKNGNGTFVTSQAVDPVTGSPTNTGSGIISPGIVLDPVAWDTAGNSQDYTVVFDVDNTLSPPVTTYDVVDNVSGDSLLTGVAADVAPYPGVYTSGNAISLPAQGIEFNVSGEPATGDSFNIKASTNQDIFQTLHELITSLRNSTSNNATISNANNMALSNFALVEDNILRVRATIGSAMKEVEAQRTAGEDLGVQYSSTISDLQDLDYAKAISDLQQKQVSLEAAQKSFVKIQGLSLFNYINT